VPAIIEESGILAGRRPWSRALQAAVTAMPDAAPPLALSS
jgi:hypothetical protein